MPDNESDLANKVESLERLVTEQFGNLDKLLDYRFSALKQQIEFGDKQSAQTIALLAPQMQRNTDDISDLKKKIERMRDEASQRLYQIIGSALAVVVAGIIVDALIKK